MLTPKIILKVVILVDELQHHGIKGQKWGVRRYQKSDGSLTPEGKKRYSDGEYKQALDKVKAADKVVKSVSKAKSDMDAKAYEKQLKYDLSKMSDKELQQAVNRLNMEERYSQVMTQRKRLEAGESRINKVLDMAGTALSGAATALTIAVAVNELINKKN